MCEYKMLIDSVHVLLYLKKFKGQSQLFKTPIYLGMMAMIPNLIFPDPDFESHSAFLSYQKHASLSWITVQLLMPGS